MIEPVDGLLLVIAQSPEAAHVVAPALLHDVLTSAQIPAVAARCEREADDVASVQPAHFPVIAIDPSQERARSGWTYFKDSRNHTHAAAISDNGGANQGLGSFVDLAA